MKKPAPHYALLVEWREEDKTWIGRCPELFLGGVHGSDRAKAYAELCQAVDEHMALAEADGAALPDALAGNEYSSRA